MNQLTSEILSITAEAGLLIEKNRIVYANSEAERLLGRDCVGKHVKALFGTDVAEMQAANFVGSMNIGGELCKFRVIKNQSQQVMLFSTIAGDPELINDAFVYLMNENLSVMDLGIKSCRERAEAEGNSAMLSVIAGMTRTQFKLRRVIKNADLIKRLRQRPAAFCPVQLDLSALLREKLALLGDLFPNLCFVEKQGESISVSADYDLVLQLLYNLVSNAEIHGKSPGSINVSLSESGGAVYLTVSDNGCGMSMQELKTVFERYKYGFDIKELGKGAGFGMSICTEIARLHGGTLIMESRPGHGTAVRVSFSKGTKSGLSFTSSPLPKGEDGPEDLLVAFADCLPVECFSEKFMD